METTEYLIHLLRTSIDALHERMIEEQRRATDEMHYHYLAEFKCNKPGCSGPDPASVTALILRDELVAIEKEFPGTLLSVRHLV